MAKKIEIDLNEFNKEYSMMEKELSSLDDLFKSSKELLDDNINGGSRRNPVFMAQQTSNLINIKDKKLSIMKEMVNIKKSKAELELKMFAANTKNDDGTNNENTEIIKGLFNMLLDKNNEEEIQNFQKLNNELIESEEDIDSYLDNRIEEELKLEEENKRKESKKTLSDQNCKIVVDMERNLYVVDYDYNLIEDSDINLDDIVIVDYIQNDDGEYFAKDSNDNFYEVVEFEED